MKACITEEHTSILVSCLFNEIVKPTSKLFVNTEGDDLAHVLADLTMFNNNSQIGNY
jgi:hypothetical protein